VEGKEEEGNELEKKEEDDEDEIQGLRQRCFVTPAATRTSEQRDAAEKTKESTASVSRQMGGSKCAGWMRGEDKAKLQLF